MQHKPHHSDGAEGWSLRAAGRSERGPVRSFNEDDFRVLAPHDLVVVCDGMGGNCGGGPASKTAVWAVVERYERGDDEGWRPPVPSGTAPEMLVVQRARARLREAVMNAHDRVRRVSMSAIGTTLVALHLCGPHVVLAHLGDCRASLWRDGELTRVTADHSLIAVAAAQGITFTEAQRESYRSINTRALGIEPSSGSSHSYADVDMHVLETRPGDVFILTTDGLHSVISADEMCSIVGSHRDDPSACVDAMMERALARDTDDNATACVALIERDGLRGPNHGRTSAPTAPWLYSPRGPLAPVPARFQPPNSARTIATFNELYKLVMGEDD